MLDVRLWVYDGGALVPPCEIEKEINRAADGQSVLFSKLNCNGFKTGRRASDVSRFHPCRQHVSGRNGLLKEE